MYQHDAVGGGETYEIIDELESEKMQFKTMKSLFNMLWLQSNNCSEEIKNMGYEIVTSILVPIVDGDPTGDWSITVHYQMPKQAE